MHKSFSKHLVSLQNFNKFAKSNRFSIFVSYSTVVSPYLFIDRKLDIFYESVSFYIWNIYKLSLISQKRYNIIFNFFGVFDDFSLSIKGSIEVISVGMERSNGIPMKILRLGWADLANRLLITRFSSNILLINYINISICMTKSARIIRMTNWANTRKLGQYEKNKANTEKQGQYENNVIPCSFSIEYGSHVFLCFAA